MIQNNAVSQKSLFLLGKVRTNHFWWFAGNKGDNVVCRFSNPRLPEGNTHMLLILA